MGENIQHKIKLDYVQKMISGSASVVAAYFKHLEEFLCNECRKEQDHIFDQKMEILSMVEAE